MKKLILLLAFVPAVALAQQKAAPTEAEIVRLVLTSPSKLDGQEALRSLKRDDRKLGVLLHIYQALDGTQAVDSADVLRNITRAQGGIDYLMKLFESLEPPEKPCTPRPSLTPIASDGTLLYTPEDDFCPYKTEWCLVGQALVRHDHLHPVHHSVIYPTCDNMIEYLEDGRSILRIH